MSKQAIVVGAGIGGLTAGALLARRGYDVSLYELLKSKVKQLNRYNIGIRTKNIYLSIKIGSKIKL